MEEMGVDMVWLYFWNIPGPGCRMEEIRSGCTFGTYACLGARMRDPGRPVLVELLDMAVSGTPIVCAGLWDVGFGCTFVLCCPRSPCMGRGKLDEGVGGR